MLVAQKCSLAINHRVISASIAHYFFCLIDKNLERLGAFGVLRDAYFLCFRILC
jgi:hypothetical protein